MKDILNDNGVRGVDIHIGIQTHIIRLVCVREAIRPVSDKAWVLADKADISANINRVIHVQGISVLILEDNGSIRDKVTKRGIDYDNVPMYMDLGSDTLTHTNIPRILRRRTVPTEEGSGGGQNVPDDDSANIEGLRLLSISNVFVMLWSKV